MSDQQGGEEGPTRTIPGGPSVLVVEDNESVADLYAAWLSDACTVETAYDAAGATEALEERAFDIVLLDRRLPDGGGDDLLPLIRERGEGTQVAMITAVDPDFDIVEKPIDGYVVKPVGEADLYHLVARLAERHTYDADVREYFALAAKKAALEAEKDPDDLEDSEEYEGLREDLEAIRGRIGTDEG
ncbi:MAG: HalX domain-containing protein [Halobacteriales archaeon]